MRKSLILNVSVYSTGSKSNQCHSYTTKYGYGQEDSERKVVENFAFDDTSVEFYDGSADSIHLEDELASRVFSNSNFAFFNGN